MSDGHGHGGGDEHEHGNDGHGDHGHSDDHGDGDGDHGHSDDHGDGHGDHGHSDDYGDGHDHHRHDAETVAVAVVTVSSSRSLEEDDSGDWLVDAFEEAGHEVVVRELVDDEFDGIQGAVDRLARRADTDTVVTTGGTGVTPDDVTPEAATPLFEKQLPGFGELFRRLSYDEIGTRTVGSRAVAGIADGTAVFCLPGSENAVRLGTEEVILPELGHLVGLASRDDENAEEESSDA